MISRSHQGLNDIDNDLSTGFEIITTDDIDDMGISNIIERIRSRVGESPVYVRYV